MNVYPIGHSTSAPHGESDRLWIQTANWSSSGGLIVGEAYRPDLTRASGGLRSGAMTAKANSAICRFSPGPAATRPPRRSSRRPWSNDPGRSASTGAGRLPCLRRAAEHGTPSAYAQPEGPQQRRLRRAGFDRHVFGSGASLACAEFPTFGDSSPRASSALCRVATNIQNRGTNRAATSRSRGGSSAQEIMQRLHDDEQIVLIRNAAPLRCGRAIYCRRLETVERVRLRKAQPLKSKTSR